MTYNNAIPQASDRPSQSQPQILSNFADLKTFLDRNHEAILDPSVNANEGKHKFLQMPENSAPSTGAAEGGVYTAGTAGYTNLYWIQEAGGADPLRDQGAVVQLTGINPNIAATGHTFLPGNMLLQWGTGTITLGNSVTINFSTPFSSAPYGAVVTPITATVTSNSTYAISLLSTTQIRITSPTVTGVPFTFIAVGPAV